MIEKWQKNFDVEHVNLNITLTNVKLSQMFKLLHEKQQ